MNRTEVVDRATTIIKAGRQGQFPTKEDLEWLLVAFANHIELESEIIIFRLGDGVPAPRGFVDMMVAHHTIKQKRDELDQEIRGWVNRLATHA